MTVDNQDLKGLLERIKLLLPEYRLRLMQGVLDTLVPAQPTETTTMIRLGQFKEFNGPISRYEDYALAEAPPRAKGTGLFNNGPSTGLKRSRQPF